jgi:uncharacterized protein
VAPEAYGEFLCRVFDRWARREPPTFIRMFDDLVHQHVYGVNPTCVFQEQCGSYFVVEHNGDLYACDFFVEPEWRLGNLMETPLTELARGDLLRQFGRRKSAHGPTCRECEWLSLCHGACPRDRIFQGGTASDPSYLCAGLKQFFAHAKPTIARIVAGLRPEPRPERTRRWKRLGKGGGS